VSQQLIALRRDATPGAVPGTVPGAETELELTLLGGFRLEIAGTRISLPTHAKRVLAYLSVCSRAQSGCSRTALADQLWPMVDGERAQASLRTALWRIRQVDRRLVTAEDDSLRLGPAVQVDLHEALDQAGRLLHQDSALQPADTVIRPLSAPLLPNWDEDWLLLERERIHQLQLHALDILATRLRRLGRYSEAVNAALTSIAIDPLRESARIELIATHLAEGNVAAAHRHFDDYASTLWTELRLKPSSSLTARIVAIDQNGP
jgi:DNA-binding SARP family transcriptional activator